MAVARLLTLYALLTRTRDVLAATHTYDWNITWTTANPDGVFERPVVGINNEWPLPMLNVTKGDRIVAKVTNGLGNETTSIHFHGMYQNGTSEMDGPVGVTQCDIPPGSTFIYNFTVDQEGSYWYHSHSRGQYPDGLRQAFFITDPEGPYLGKYDAEIPITLSDWYHDQMPTLLKQFINVENPTGAEPVPKNALMNDTQNLKVPVEAGKTYMLRIVNIGAFAGQYFWIEGHTMRIVEVDGIWTNESETDMIYITAAQRYSVLVTMKNSTTSNYVIQASMDTSLFDTVPSDLNWNVTGWLQYDSSASFPTPAVKDELNPFDDFYLVPTDGEALLPHSDLAITLDLTMDNLGDGANYAFFNDISYVTPKVPTLFSVMSTGADAVNPMVYGTDSNAYVLNKGDVVDIVLNNDDTGKHPFHLHGHNFQVIERSNENDGHWNSANESSYPAIPMRRDTLMVRPLGNFVIRFVADNPGVWFFHCHIDWHLVTGLAALMIEAPLEMQKTLSIPDNHYEVCKAANTPYAGNAAGNTVDYLDLTGENRMVKRLPSGFTNKGYVALVFSCISGALGMAAVAWYGTLPITPAATRTS